MITISNAPRRVAQACIAVLVLATGCSASVGATEEAVTAPDEPVASETPLDSCLVINPSGVITKATAPGCQAHGSAIVGFHEGAELMDRAFYLPAEGHATAELIRAYVTELEGDPTLVDRSAALEVVASIWEETGDAWALRAPSVESSLGADAAYIEFVTRDAWNSYFETFFTGPTAADDAAHVVERIFVRMRGFELE